MHRTKQNILVRDVDLVRLGKCPWSLSKLRQDRHFKRGLPYRKVGKSVFYDLDDVREYFDRHKIIPEG